MKTPSLPFALVLSLCLCACEQKTPPVSAPITTNTLAQTNAPTRLRMRDPQEQRAAQWLGSLQIDDLDKKQRLVRIIGDHLNAVRDWHNQQLELARSEGTNSLDAQGRVPLERQMTADAAMPRSVHSNLMAGLTANLSPEQVETILNNYTSRRAPVTMASYRAIVTDLTPEEDAHLLGLLNQAREEAIDYKSTEQIVTIFNRYKEQCQQYLIARGRDWNTLSNTYARNLEAQKAATATNAPGAEPAR